MALALPLGAAQAQDQTTYVMKMSTPTIHDIPDTFARNYGAALEKDSGGRIKVEVYPASQLGSIPRQIEGTQFGAIQCEIVPPEFMVGLDRSLRGHGRARARRFTAARPARRRRSGGAQADALARRRQGPARRRIVHGRNAIVVTRNPIRHLEDFKGKKLRIFASQFQSEAFERLGVTPVAMTLGDVLPAIQQGAIDGAITGMGPVAHMHFVDAAKYVTMTNQPAIFIIVEINKKWYESLPKDLQQIVDKDAAAQSVAINPIAIDIRKQSEASYTASGGELIKLPPDEQATLMKTLSSVGTDVSMSNPRLAGCLQVRDRRGGADAAGRQPVIALARRPSYVPVATRRESMLITARDVVTRASAAAFMLSFVWSFALSSAALAADDKPIAMKISFPTVGEALQQVAMNYAAAIEKDSGGRIKTEVYPASRLGSIQGQAEGVQFGAIQCQIVAPEFLAGIDERFEVLAAPGLVNTMEQGQRLAADPAVQTTDARSWRR